MFVLITTIIAIAIFTPIILWLDSRSANPDTSSIEEWHNFRSALSEKASK
jgi:hypothetical protein